MKSFRKNLSLKEERRGTDTEKTFERSLGPLGFRTLNKKFCKERKKSSKIFGGERPLEERKRTLEYDLCT